MATTDAALKGLRGPPNEIAVLGASNYLTETLRPGGTHNRRHAFVVENQPAVAGRGKINEERNRAVLTETTDPAATMADAFKQSAALCAAVAPVHIHDLKDIATKTTQELIEKESEVSVV
jgi:hypothetical protein